MSIDITERESPGWWLQKLSKKLELRQPRLQDLANWMEGDAPFLCDVDPLVADSYKKFRRTSRTNYAELIVQTLRRRLIVTGFRTAADDSPAGDVEAMRLWDDNGMQIELPDILENMLGLGDGYAIVGRIDPDEDDEDGESEVVITGEDPRQVVTIHDPIRQRVIRAGMKIYHDSDEDLDVAYLHLPGRVFRATRSRRATAATANRVPRFSASAWDWDEDAGGEQGEETGVDRVLIVRFRCRKGIGVFENHTDLLERLDQQVFRRDVIAAVQAFRQKAAIGTPDVDDDGNPIDWNSILIADPGAFWRLPAGSEMWESAGTDIRPLIDADTADVKKLSAVTSTPMHVFFPDAASGSAEGAALMRDEHVANAKDVQARANEAVRDCMSLAFELAGDKDRAKRKNITVLWAPVERRSLAEQADANTKMQDVPWRTRMTTVLGYTEAEVDQMEIERKSDDIDRRVAERRAERTVDPAPDPELVPAGG